MKKLLVFLIIAAFAIAGCGDEKAPANSAPKAAPAASSASNEPVMLTGADLQAAKDAWKKKGMGDLESVAKYPDGTIVETFESDIIITKPDGKKTYKTRDDKKIDITKGDGKGIHHFGK